MGAGILGFVINPPIALYYIQGLNTTPAHAHAALFGVYGMLGIGLMLFVLKGLAARNVWKNGVIKFAFWSINIGLALMILLSILPIGMAQTWASVKYGFWYAPVSGIYASSGNGGLTVVKGNRRYHLYNRYPCIGLVCYWIKNRMVSKR